MNKKQWPWILLVCSAVGAGVAAWVGYRFPDRFTSVLGCSAACLYLGLPLMVIGAWGWMFWFCTRWRPWRCMAVAAQWGLIVVVCFVLVLPMACRHFMRAGIASDRKICEQMHRQLLTQLEAGVLRPDSGFDNVATDPVLKWDRWEGYMRLPATEVRSRRRDEHESFSVMTLDQKKPLHGKLAVMMARPMTLDIYDGRSWATISMGTMSTGGWLQWFDFPAE